MAHGQASRSLAFGWTLMWPSLHSMVTCEPAQRDLPRDRQERRIEAAFPLIRLGGGAPTPGSHRLQRGNGYLTLAGRRLSTLAELSEKAKRLLKGKNFAFVATVNKDGSPQLTPTWVDTDGENVLVNTALGRQKTRTSRGTPG